MVMLWIFFVIGLLVATVGIITQASENNIQYKQWRFDAENLGRALIWFGGSISVSMLIGILLIMGLKIFN